MVSSWAGGFRDLGFRGVGFIDLGFRASVLAFGV